MADNSASHVDSGLVARGWTDTLPSGLVDNDQTMLSCWHPEDVARLTAECVCTCHGGVFAYSVPTIRESLVVERSTFGPGEEYAIAARFTGTVQRLSSKPDETWAVFDNDRIAIDLSATAREFVATMREELAHRMALVLDEERKLRDREAMVVCPGFLRTGFSVIVTSIPADTFVERHGQGLHECISSGGTAALHSRTSRRGESAKL